MATGGHAPQGSSAPSSNTILLDALTFDGTPFRVSLPSLKTAGRSIFVGHIVDSDQRQLVAVKMIGNRLEDHDHELLIRELRAARQVSISGHPFILPFLGSATFGLQTAIISNYMQNGNLIEYFKAHRGNRSIDKKKLILQVASAVIHLHVFEGLVHGDLKCENVLVSDTGDALLGDFGLSTFVEKAQTSATTATNIRQMCTVRFAAPEILNDVAGHPCRVRSKTRETDVYAFGMLVLQALTEEPPWSEVTPFTLIVWVSRGYQPVRPINISQAWWDVCTICWSFLPKDRPTMQHVHAKLSAIPWWNSILPQYDWPHLPSSENTFGPAPVPLSLPSPCLLPLFYPSWETQMNDSNLEMPPTPFKNRVPSDWGMSPTPSKNRAPQYRHHATSLCDGEESDTCWNEHEGLGLFEGEPPTPALDPVSGDLSPALPEREPVPLAAGLSLQDFAAIWNIDLEDTPMINASSLPAEREQRQGVEEVLVFMPEHCTYTR